MDKYNKVLLLIIILLATSGQFATEIYLPSMPNMANYFAVPLKSIQFSITMYALGYSIGSIFWGYFSDKFGRRLVILPCLGVAILGGVICSVAMNLEWLLVGRCIQGIGLSGAGVSSRSIARDIAKNKVQLAKLASVTGILATIAMAIAPILGGYIEKYSFWRINFITLLLLSVTIAILCWFKLEETNSNRGKFSWLNMFHEYKEVMSCKNFAIYNALGTFTFTGLVAYQTVSPYFLQVKVGLAPDQFGYTSLVVIFALMLGGIFNNRMVTHRGIEQMLFFGCALFFAAGCCYILFGLLHFITLISILTPIMLFSFSAGIIYPNASSGALSLFSTKAGTAASIYNFFQMVGAVLGSGLMSIVHHTSQVPLGVIFVFLGVIGIVLVLFIEQDTIVSNC